MRNYALTAFTFVALSAFFMPASALALTCYTNTGSLVLTNSTSCPAGTSLTNPQPSVTEPSAAPTQTTTQTPTTQSDTSGQTVNIGMDKFGNPILTPQLPNSDPNNSGTSPSATSPASAQQTSAPAVSPITQTNQTTAKSSGLVQCGNPGQPACNICSFLSLIKSLIDFAMTTAFAFAGLFITWGAFVTMTAGGSEERVKEGRKIITTAVVGMVIMLSAWLILGTVVQVLTGSPSKLPWTEIKCTF